MEEHTYTPFNEDSRPDTFYSWKNNSRKVVQFFMNNSYLYGVVSLSIRPVNACILFRTNSLLFDVSCKLGDQVIKVDDQHTVLSLDCKKYAFIILAVLSSSCYDLHTPGSNLVGSYHLLVANTNYKKSRLQNLAYCRNQTNIVVTVWLQSESKVGVIKLQLGGGVDNVVPNKNKFIEWTDITDPLLNSSQNVILDVKPCLQGLLVSLNDGCIYLCPGYDCTNVTKYTPWRRKRYSNYTLGKIVISASGTKMLHIDSVIEGPSSKQGTNIAATYVVEFNVMKFSSKRKEWKQCGSFSVSDIVFTYSNRYDAHRTYYPCQLDHYGNFLACLILGEPYIFDISDCVSAHPISSFSISSLRLGYAVNRFGFLEKDSIFYEIVSTEGIPSYSSHLGIVYDIKQELQPTLISSQIIYPTLATAIKPMESFILVDSNKEKLYIFTHSGRIFSSKSKKSRFEIQLEYRHDLSMFITESLRNTNSSEFPKLPNSYNFEHPFAFFAPNYKKLVYLSHYQSVFGSFSASAVTVADITNDVAKTNSIIRIGESNILVQVGVSFDNNLLVLVHISTADDYLNVKIVGLDRLPEYSTSNEHVISESEITGSWNAELLPLKESSRVWIIPFTSKNNFFIICHNKNISSTIIEYQLQDDFTIKKYRLFIIPDCYIITNINDYSSGQAIILCVSFNGSNSKQSLYKILVSSFRSDWNIECEYLIDIPFHKITKTDQDDDKQNIPLFSYDPIVRRVVIGLEHVLYVYSIKTCPFSLLYVYHNHHSLSSVSMLTLNLSKTLFSVALLSYLQRLDAVSDCTNGYGTIHQLDASSLYCSRCGPGRFGLGCQACTAGFYCQGYSQLQPTGPCPEGYYCLEGTSFGPQWPFDVKSLNSSYSFPNICPEGSYCPAGTATFNTDDLTHNNPKPCLEGFYCPPGSTKPTQFSCPFNSNSPPGSKSLINCFCKEGYFGDTVNIGKCIKCLEHGICNTHKKDIQNVFLMTIPVGFWPNLPNNTFELLKCEISLTGKSACVGGWCELRCSKRKDEKSKKCLIICTNVCATGNSGRLCSKCDNNYYKKSNAVCIPCQLSMMQYLIISIVSFVCFFLLFWFLIRKFTLLKYCPIIDKYSIGNHRDGISCSFISDDILLEMVLALTLLVAGLSSASSLFLLFFTVFVIYVQQLRSPPYTKNIFIFYVQTLQALTEDKFIWPKYLSVFYGFFEIIYSPFPSLSCVQNVFTGKSFGWYGKNLTFFFLPILIGIFVAFIVGIVYRINKTIAIGPIMMYLMLMSILQFPLGSFSLSALACAYDHVTNSYYMISEPWFECGWLTVAQICGALGVLFYLLGFPTLLHYWYWKSNFLNEVKDRIGELILPAGTKEDSLFLIFITTRSIILAMVVSVIPTDWDISNLIILIILGLNIVIVLHRKPYHYDTRVDSLTIPHFWIMSGEFLEVASAFIILVSVFILSSKSNLLSTEIKSVMVGLLNLFFCLYFIFGIILLGKLSNALNTIRY